MDTILLTPDFIKKASQIKLVIFDIDGVFTNGLIYVDDNGIESKAFNVLDGQGIKFLQETNIQIAIISGRKAPGVDIRMKQLGIKHIFLGYPNKIPVYEELLKTLQLQDHNIAYVGDDLPDLPLIRRAGLGITVPNAVPDVLSATQWITKTKGGKGAVREVCECLIKAIGAWEKIIKRFMTVAD